MTCSAGRFHELRLSSLFGGLRSSAFELSTSPAFDVFRGPLLLFGIGASALPLWDQKNEAEQSVSRPDCVRSVQKARRTHLIHRPAKDIFPPDSGTLLSPFEAMIFGMRSDGDRHDFFLVQRNCVPSLQRRCMITASRRASATIAFCGRAAWRRSLPRPSARTISSPASAGPARLRKAAFASCHHRTARSGRHGGFRQIH